MPPRPREAPATELEATIDGRTFRLGDRLVLRLAGRIDTYDRMLDGRTATLERIYIDYDDKVHLGVTIDDDPGQELMRETGRFHFFFAGEVELVPQRAAIDTGGLDGSHGRPQEHPRRGGGQPLAPRRRLRWRRRQAACGSASFRRASQVADFGTGGLDLAYEVMRGYDALVLVDISRQGGEPGTLYVMEADPESIEAGIEDGDMIDPHDMDPQTVLRFVKSVNGWPGKVIVVACEPAEIEDFGIGLSPAVEAAVEQAVGLVAETVRRAARGLMHELSIAGAIVATVERHAGGRAVTSVRVRVGRLRQVVPDSLEFCFGMVARESVCEGARLEIEVVPAVLRCAGCGHEWEIRRAAVPVPGVRGRRRRGGEGRGARGRVHRGRGGAAVHRTRVRVVESALDANDTIAMANRGDFDRAGVAVVNLMSAPGAGQDDAARARAAAPARRAGGGARGRRGRRASTPTASSRLHVPVTQLNTDQGFGGECHLDANMVRSALPEVPLDEIDLLVIENVGNLVCPAEFRVGEDARAMVCSITEGEDKPLKYPLMFRACELVVVNKIDLLPHLDVDLDLLLANIDAVNPDVPRLLTSARTGEGVDALRDWLVGVAARERVAT